LGNIQSEKTGSTLVGSATWAKFLSVLDTVSRLLFWASVTACARFEPAATLPSTLPPCALARRRTQNGAGKDKIDSEFTQAKSELIRLRIEEKRKTPISTEVRRKLGRIADTADAVDYITFCNLANLDAAIPGLLLDVIEVQLKFVGKGFAPDITDAPALIEELHRPFRNFCKEQRRH
jgi:hypothetical protein